MKVEAGMRGSTILAAAALVMTVTVVPEPPSARALPRRRNAVTFTKDVAPILQRSCQNCHRPDSNAPMSLITYEDARPYARSIKAKTASRLMPPWHIERNIGIQKFKDDPSLTEQEIATIAAWVDQGAPKGDMAHMPPPRKFEDDDVWHIGKPDLIVEIPQPHVVPASGPDVWIDYIADSGLTEDRYVQAVETKPGPGARTVMHHLLTYLIQDVADNEKLVGQDDVRQQQTETFLNEYAVGKNGDILPRRHRQADEGRLEGALQHSLPLERQGNGRSFSRGMKFYPKGYVPEVPPDFACRSRRRTASSTFRRAPSAATTGTTASTSRCRSRPFRRTCTTSASGCASRRFCRPTRPCSSTAWDGISTGTRSTTTPTRSARSLPAGTVLHGTLWHDNTKANRANPDPRNWRGYGQRTIDEMGFAWITWSNLEEADYKAKVAERTKLRETN